MPSGCREEYFLGFPNEVYVKYVIPGAMFIRRGIILTDLVEIY